MTKNLDFKVLVGNDVLVSCQEEEPMKISDCFPLLFPQDANKNSDKSFVLNNERLGSLSSLTMNSPINSTSAKAEQQRMRQQLLTMQKQRQSQKLIEQVQKKQTKSKPQKIFSPVAKILKLFNKKDTEIKKNRATASVSTSTTSLPKSYSAQITNDASILPFANTKQVEILKKENSSSSGIVFIAGERFQVRFYGDQAVVLQDEPRDISYQKSEATNVFVNRELITCFLGKPVEIELDGKKHTIKLGNSPTREFYFDDDYYEASYGNAPFRVLVDRKVHLFRIQGSSPQIKIGQVSRHDLLAGQIHLFIDDNIMTIYLDETPQLIDLEGFPVILRFCDHFNGVFLNDRPFRTHFGTKDICVTVPSGKKHTLRFSKLSDLNKKTILDFLLAAREKSSLRLDPFGFSVLVRKDG